MNVAFHILTLGIPWAMYMLTANHKPKESPIVYSQELAPFKKIEHQDVIDTACQKAAQLKPAHLRQNLAPPTDHRILKLWRLLAEEELAFNQLLQKYKDQTPWTQREVLLAAHTLMETAYSVSVLTLEDLHEINQPKSSYVERLMSQQSYAYRTFFDCTRVYHEIRGSWEYVDGRIQPPEQRDSDGNYVISESHSVRFYEEENDHSHWRNLYNEFCQRVKMYISEYDLQHANDRRYAHWVVPDTDVKEIFHPYPDTLPT